jgi:hypothetical protein
VRSEAGPSHVAQIESRLDLRRELFRARCANDERAPRRDPYVHWACLRPSEIARGNSHQHFFLGPH